MKGLDIPDGTKIEKVMKGGENALKAIIDLVSDKNLNGYVRVKLEKGNEIITSYIIIKESMPKLGLREIVTRDEKDPRRKVTKIFAGENTMQDVKKDTNNEDAKIQVHSGVDVEAILSRYTKDKKPEPPQIIPREEKQTRDARRVGLFWGGKEADEVVEREVLQEKIKTWRREGYDVSELGEIFSKEIPEIKAAFAKYQEGIATLEDMAAELELLSLTGFENEVKNIKEKLKSPSQIPIIREEIKALENRVSKKEPESAGNICLVCGFPVSDESKCPRCGALIEGKVEKAETSEGMELVSGRCYLIEEEKPSKSLSVFAEVIGTGYKGFCITRTNPKHLRTLRNLNDTKILWLTDKESATEDTIPPVLERLMYEVNDFLRREEKGVLILDGTEYLISSNSFDAVLRFIRRLVDEISETKSIFLVTVSPYTLNEKELKILEKELEKLSFEEKEN